MPDKNSKRRIKYMRGLGEAVRPDAPAPGVAGNKSGLKLRQEIMKRTVESFVMMTEKMRETGISFSEAETALALAAMAANNNIDRAREGEERTVITECSSNTIIPLDMLYLNRLARPDVEGNHGEMLIVDDPLGNYNHLLRLEEIELVKKEFMKMNRDPKTGHLLKLGKNGKPIRKLIW